jgi:5-methylthioribose kinase
MAGPAIGLFIEQMSYSPGNCPKIYFSDDRPAVVIEMTIGQGRALNG